MMPLGMTHADGSPYQSLSTHAGNTLLISLDWLVDRGWLEKDIWDNAENNNQWRFDTLERGCMHALDVIDGDTCADFERFMRGQSYWLDDYAQFVVLKKMHQGASWVDWPAPLRRHETAAIDEALKDHQKELELRKFEQYLFFRQWRCLLYTSPSPRDRG